MANGLSRVVAVRLSESLRGVHLVVIFEYFPAQRVHACVYLCVGVRVWFCARCRVCDHVYTRVCHVCISRMHVRMHASMHAQCV